MHQTGFEKEELPTKDYIKSKMNASADIVHNPKLIFSFGQMEDKNATQLDVSTSNISSFIGISEFTKIRQLNINNLPIQNFYGSSLINSLEIISMWNTPLMLNKYYEINTILAFGFQVKEINSKKIDIRLVEYIKDHPHLDELTNNVQSGRILMKFPIYELSCIDELFYSPYMFVSSQYSIVYDMSMPYKRFAQNNLKYNMKKSKNILSRLKESSKNCYLSESKACHYFTSFDSHRLIKSNKNEMIDEETMTKLNGSDNKANDSQRNKDYATAETQKSEKCAQQENCETQMDISERIDASTVPCEIEDPRTNEEIEKYKNAYLECQKKLNQLQDNSNKLQHNYELLLKVLDTIKIEDISGEDISVDSLLVMPNIS